MAVRLYNTLTRTTEDFQPLEDMDVRMYTCGPTVYNYAHIGNYRAYIFEDLLRRYLKFRGHRMTQVMNLTDVDDKTIRFALEKGVSLDEYTRKYKEAFFEDMRTLNVEQAEYYPSATEHIQDMIDLIHRLFEKGYAYQSEDGSIYFSIEKFKSYGQLAHLDMSGLQAGARVAQDEYEKENAGDFALWKAWNEKDGDVSWESPWGKGRPGWHIECSAMSMRYLGESFDIHTGGIDNIFPHHEDEIAQSEGATGKPFVRYWLHCAHLVVDGKKMSKSLGNFYALRDILARGYNGREIRYQLISTHYRQALNFTFEGLDAARAALARLDEFVGRLQEKLSAEEPETRLPAWAEECQGRFLDALDDDLNISGALGALFDMVHAGNKAMDEDSVALEEIWGTRKLLDDWHQVLGFLRPQQETEVDKKTLAILDLREKARKAKNWAEADRLREELAARGWEVKDTSEGAKLKRL